MIKVRLNRFIEQYNLFSLKDSESFEKYVNFSILSNHQPDAFGADSDFLNKVCVGGGNDLGIDGIGIKLNGFLVSNIDEAKDIVNKFQKLVIEFIFIQSKFSNNFDSGEFIKFTSGIRDFLSETQRQPCNKSIKNFIDIKNYVMSDDVIIHWERNPTVRAYYVTLGKWQETPHFNAHSEQFKSDLSAGSAYSECNIHFIDAYAFKKICDNNENTFNTTIEVIDTMPLTEVDGVNNSCVVLCYASEFMKLLSTDEGVIRKSLFDDNVRDYQGNNSVNEEILRTIDEEPEKFALLNNGITIVCDEYIQSNRRITLKNPQIVNGCQTSHVLFFAQRDGKDINKSPLHIKVISTSNFEITNQIVRGTNRQNIVYDEAFEATKIFHKELEEFFIAIGVDYGKIYYERRSKQFSHNPKIKQTEKINIKILTQYCLAILLNKPHMAHRHEAKLIEEYSSKIFLKHHSKLPYYMASLLFSNAEKLFRQEKYKEKELHTYKPHILMVFRELCNGAIPSLHKEKQVDMYCKKILDIVSSAEQFEIMLDKSIGVFELATKHWINDLKKSSDGRKDIEEFTKILILFCSEEKNQRNCDDIQNIVEDPDLSYGEVVKRIRDRNGFNCGFISTHDGRVFFHANDNPHLDFSNIVGKSVSYKKEANEKSGRIYGMNVTLI